MKFVAGFDGGGTKTIVSVLTVDGEKKSSASFGAMNLNGTKSEEVEQTIKESFQWLSITFGGFDNFAAVCIGSAGISNPKAVILLQRAVRASGYKGKLLLLGDHEIAFSGALSGRDGAVLIAGTGSICVGRVGERYARAGGYGHLIDDEGSGYAIGRDILSSVVRSFDARGVCTSLTEAVCRQLKVGEVSSLIQFVYDKNTTKKEIAALAVLLNEALEKRDKEAIKIANKASKGLFELVSGVVNSLNITKGDIAFMGSILKYYQYISYDLTKRLKISFPKLRVIQPEQDAAYGAALYALKKLN